MSEVDPLIKREMQWMALGVYENRDLAPIIIAKVRRQRIRRAIISTFAVLAIAGASIVCVGSTGTISNTTTGGSWSTNNANVAVVNAVTGVVSGK
jgi:hypothetical protein